MIQPNNIEARLNFRIYCKKNYILKIFQVSKLIEYFSRDTMQMLNQWGIICFYEERYSKMKSEYFNSEAQLRMTTSFNSELKRYFKDKLRKEYNYT